MRYLFGILLLIIVQTEALAGSPRDLTSRMVTLTMLDDTYSLTFTALGNSVFAHLESLNNGTHLASPVQIVDRTNFADVTYLDPMHDKLDVRFRVPVGADLGNPDRIVQVWFMIDLTQESQEIKVTQSTFERERATLTDIKRFKTRATMSRIPDFSCSRIVR